jgi:glycosyltransferase involved in cell wall biosynthesis
MRKETVAFWIQLEPHQALAGEGIGQHMAQLLSAWDKADSGTAELLAPRWCKPVLDEMMRIYDLPRDRIIPRYFGPRLLTAIVTRQSAPKERPADISDFGFTERLEKVPFMGLLTLLFLPLAPFFALALIAWRLGGGGVRTIAQRILAHGMRLTRAASYASMAAYANRSNHIDFCIVPLGNWSLCRLIKKKPYVVQIPDVVFLEFPELFDRNQDVNNLSIEIGRVAKQAGAVISVSEHVRRNHVIKFLGVEPRRARLALHAPMRLDDALASNFKDSGPPTKAQARDWLALHWQDIMARPGLVDRMNGSLNWLSHAKKLNVRGTKLLYFATQYRPYKNIERAIEAMAHVRERNKEPVALLLTASLAGGDAITALIDKHNLWDVVIPLPRLPQPIHATIYAAADLAVAASRFEGGLPFLFSEAVSVGTPVIMAETAIVRASMPAALRGRMMFDPLDTDHMAGAIVRGLNDPSLFLEQSRILATMTARRTWADVVNDYLKAGRDAMEYKKEPEVKKLDLFSPSSAKA